MVASYNLKLISKPLGSFSAKFLSIYLLEVFMLQVSECSTQIQLEKIYQVSSLDNPQVYLASTVLGSSFIR